MDSQFASANHLTPSTSMNQPEGSGLASGSCELSLPGPSTSGSVDIRESYKRMKSQIRSVVGDGPLTKQLKFEHVPDSQDYIQMFTEALPQDQTNCDNVLIHRDNLVELLFSLEKTRDTLKHESESHASSVKVFESKIARLESELACMRQDILTDILKRQEYDRSRLTCHNFNPDVYIYSESAKKLINKAKKERFVANTALNDLFKCSEKLDLSLAVKQEIVDSKMFNKEINIKQEKDTSNDVEVIAYKINTSSHTTAK